MGKVEIRFEIDEVLAEQALAADLDIQRIAETVIRDELNRRDEAGKAATWAAENVEAIRDHEERIARHGVFGDDLRSW